MTATPGFDTDGIVFLEGESETEVRPPGELRAIGTVPLLVDTQWRNGVLLNAAEYDGYAWAIYRDERLAHRVGYRRWEERLPAGAEPVANSMPRANVATTWGDFLVLGDIMWKADPSSPLEEGNLARYPHGLWYSEPGSFDTWDELEVEFIGQRSGGNRIVGMFPVEAGMVVATTSGMYVLRGTPADHDFEPHRVGVGPRRPEAVTFWPQAGVVLWVDRRGQVWHTNGEDASRLDEALPEYDHQAGGDDAVTVLDKFAVVSRGGRLYALHTSQQTGAAWTELNGPATDSLQTFRGSIYGAGPDGFFRWGPEVPAWRGHRDGVPVESEVATRTLVGENPHEVAFWHRSGLRSSGGTLKRATSKAGPWAGDAEVLEDESGQQAGRALAVWPAHGPSVEASFGWLFEGAVTFEGVTVWAHKGRPSR